jgi:geranylgeranyl reductase family protein
MKIIIVGAGPIGCYVAQLFKKFSSSADVVNIEEHSQVGKPVHCAGLVSNRIFKESRIPLDTGCIINRIDGAKFFFNSGNFLIRRKQVAVVVDRCKFDSNLSKDLKIVTNTRFVGIEKNNDGYLIETDKGEHYADIVIGADGANSLLRRAIGVKENINYFRGVQFRIKSKCKSNVVNVYIKSPFFAWAIPESDSVMRVGIISDNPYHDLLDLLEKESINGEVLEKFAGVVPLGRCYTQKENIFLVGDAACQVKPLTHGGLYYGMRCADILVDCILENKPRDYHKKWLEKFGNEINVGLKMREIYTRLNQENIDKMFTILKENVETIEKFGDFETHSRVISEIIKNPRLQILFGRMLFTFFKDMNSEK